MYRALIEATAFGTRTIIDAFEGVGACVAGRITRERLDEIERNIDAALSGLGARQPRLTALERGERVPPGSIGAAWLEELRAGLPETRIFVSTGTLAGHATAAIQTVATASFCVLIFAAPDRNAKEARNRGQNGRIRG